MKINIIKKILSSTALVAVLLFLILPIIMSATPAQAEPWVDISGSACATRGDCNPCDLVSVTVRYVNGIFYSAGTMAMFMFAFGGFVMLTAYGNENRITWGKNVIVATIIGTFIVFTAWVLTSVFIGAFFGNPTGGSQIKIFTNSWSSCPTEGNLIQTNEVDTPGLVEGVVGSVGTTVEKMKE